MKISSPLTNTQLEILKAFSYHLNKKELLEFNKVIAQYFAQRAVSAANKVWDEKNWTDEDANKMLTTKMRKAK